MLPEGPSVPNPRGAVEVHNGFSPSRLAFTSYRGGNAFMGVLKVFFFFYLLVFQHAIFEEAFKFVHFLRMLSLIIACNFSLFYVSVN